MTGHGGEDEDEDGNGEWEGNGMELLHHSRQAVQAVQVVPSLHLFHRCQARTAEGSMQGRCWRGLVGLDDLRTSGLPGSSN